MPRYTFRVTSPFSAITGEPLDYPKELSFYEEDDEAAFVHARRSLENLNVLAGLVKVKPTHPYPYIE